MAVGSPVDEDHRAGGAVDDGGADLAFRRCVASGQPGHGGGAAAPSAVRPGRGRSRRATTRRGPAQRPAGRSRRHARRRRRRRRRRAGPPGRCPGWARHPGCGAAPGWPACGWPPATARRSARSGRTARRRRRAARTPAAPAGGKVSSTTNNANPTASASIAWCSGSSSPTASTIGSGTRATSSSRGRARRLRSVFRQIRATTVVSQASRLAICRHPGGRRRSAAARPPARRPLRRRPSPACGRPAHPDAAGPPGNVPPGRAIAVTVDRRRAARTPCRR